MSQAPDAPDFRLEKYKLDREHELELYRATAEYEHAWFRTVTLLNGGAAGAFITMLGAVWKENSNPWVLPAMLAIVAWAGGLILTTIATRNALKGQEKYANAARWRRQTEEVRRFQDNQGLLLPYQKIRAGDIAHKLQKKAFKK